MQRAEPIVVLGESPAEMVGRFALLSAPTRLAVGKEVPLPWVWVHPLCESRSPWWETVDVVVCWVL